MTSMVACVGGGLGIAFPLAALIKRHQGDIQESLRLFQAATLLNPHNPENLKQVARSLSVVDSQRMITTSLSGLRGDGGKPRPHLVVSKLFSLPCDNVVIPHRGGGAGLSRHLLGRHKNALDVFDEASKLSEEDWEIWHNKGVCNMFLKDYESVGATTPLWHVPRSWEEWVTP